MLRGQRLNVETGMLLLRDTTKVIEPRRGEVAPHVAHRGGRRMHGVSDLGGSAKGIDEGAGKSVHGQRVTITVCSSQPEKYHNSNCHNGTMRLNRMMPYEDIQRQLAEKGKLQVDMANMLGILPNAISKAFAGKRRFTAEEMDKIRAWMGGAEGPLPGAQVGTIPVLGRVAASGFSDPAAQAVGRMHKPDPSIPDRAIALDVEGDSMDKFVPEGGRIIYDPEDRALWPRRFYVVLNAAGETTFKRFFSDPARLEPCSNNPVHGTIALNGDEPYTIVGRVIWQASRMPD